MLNALQFRNLFTMDEKRAIYKAAASFIDIRIWLDDLAVATVVHLQDAKTINGVRGLQAAGILTQERADTILATPNEMQGAGHAMKYVTNEGATATFVCLKCGKPCNFALPGQGEPAALSVADGYVVPQDPEQWIGPCNE